ncbi:MAG: lysophospholipase [Deltaproteobacteria bacterium]|nr:lysophospholipase [Deltaproteobacteria bacterium]
MIHREGQFAGHGGLRLYWQAWLPEAETRAALLVAHGYGEHGGRYGNLVERFVPRGFAVYALDHRGHGRSEGPRGHVGRFTELVADLHALRVRVEEMERGRPLFLLGHSLGGLIAVGYLLTHASGLAGAVLSSPALALAERPPRPLRWLARGLSIVAPRTSLRGNVRPELLSRDSAVGAAYVTDPLVHRRATARFFTEFERAARDAEERAPEIRLPVLVLQAGDDRLVQAAAAERFAARLGSEVKELRVYSGLFHEIFNETERERVFADLERWMEARLAAAAAAGDELRRPASSAIARRSS